MLKSMALWFDRLISIVYKRWSFKIRGRCLYAFMSSWDSLYLKWALAIDYKSLIGTKAIPLFKKTYLRPIKVNASLKGTLMKWDALHWLGSFWLKVIAFLCFYQIGSVSRRLSYFTPSLELIKSLIWVASQKVMRIWKSLVSWVRNHLRNSSFLQ